MQIIKKQLTLEYWEETNWLEGRLREVPCVLSQGESLDQLEENVREDCAIHVAETDCESQKRSGFLDAADIRNAELRVVKLTRFEAAIAQLQVLSPERAEKVFVYIEDLVDLEALEDRADAEDDKREAEEKNPWEIEPEDDEA